MSPISTKRGSVTQADFKFKTISIEGKPTPKQRKE